VIEMVAHNLGRADLFRAHLGNTMLKDTGSTEFNGDPPISTMPASTARSTAMPACAR